MKLVVRIIKINLLVELRLVILKLQVIQIIKIGEIMYLVKNGLNNGKVIQQLIHIQMEEKNLKQLNLNVMMVLDFIHLYLKRHILFLLLVEIEERMVVFLMELRIMY